MTQRVEAARGRLLFPCGRSHSPFGVMPGWAATPAYGVQKYAYFRIDALRTGWVARLQRSCVPTSRTEKLVGGVIERFQVAHNDQHHGRSRNASALFNAGNSRRSGHHAWAFQTKNLAGIRGPAGHFRFWSEPANHGGRRANGGRQRLHGLLRRFAHQFHSATHLEFGEQ
jgi:hypothetical protein